MSEAYLGEIKMVAFDFAPMGWAICDGILLPKGQNKDLFTLLGTKFGGDGVTNFGLPNMRGNVPVHQGQAPGRSMYQVGQTGGVVTTTLTSQQLALHTHVFMSTGQTATTVNPAGGILAIEDVNARFDNNKMYTTATTPVVSMLAGTVAPAGTDAPAPHNNMMPYQAQFFIICLNGEFPHKPT